MRLPRMRLRAGRSRGNGGPLLGGPLGFSEMGAGLSVYGGGLRGSFSSAILKKKRLGCMVRFPGWPVCLD